MTGAPWEHLIGRLLPLFYLWFSAPWWTALEVFLRRGPLPSGLHPTSPRYGPGTAPECRPLSRSLLRNN